MDNSSQEEEDKNQKTLDEYSNQLLFPSLGLSCHSTFLTTYSIDTCFTLSKEVQPTIFQLESQTIPQKNTRKNILKNSKSIRRKTKQNQKTKNIVNKVLNEIQDLIQQINSHHPFYHTQYVQKLKSLIENLENLLGNMKHQLLVQIKEQDFQIDKQ
ncbi:unnamed protein product [Paramecium pentaurelia]|uniref:Uncharacterized protein n=1 Tax=Paramecium pentaurelia TaxID=43138 RepID=A0A8S1SUK4_9CILI|nr:unnamed protein product [Paramecium pentaurelia]